MNATGSRRPATWVVALAWLVVALPLAWGVYQSVNNARPLFRTTGPPR